MVGWGQPLWSPHPEYEFKCNFSPSRVGCFVHCCIPGGKDSAWCIAGIPSIFVKMTFLFQSLGGGGRLSLLVCAWLFWANFCSVYQFPSKAATCWGLFMTLRYPHRPGTMNSSHLHGHPMCPSPGLPAWFLLPGPLSTLHIQPAPPSLGSQHLETHMLAEDHGCGHSCNPSITICYEACQAWLGGKVVGKGAAPGPI